VSSSKPAAYRKTSSDEGQPARAVHGNLVGVDLKTGTVAVEFAGSSQPGVGSRLRVSRHFAFETVEVGEVEIVFSAKNGRAIARPIGKLGITELAKGDAVNYRPASRPQRDLETAKESIAAAAPPAGSGPKVHRASSKSAPESSRSAPASSAPAKSAPAKPAQSRVSDAAGKRRTNAVPARPRGLVTSADDGTASCSDEAVESVAHLSDEGKVAPASYPKTRDTKAPARLPPPNRLRE
jgi:hypothetical protein